MYKRQPLVLLNVVGIVDILLALPKLPIVPPVVPPIVPPVGQLIDGQLPDGQLPDGLFILISILMLLSLPILMSVSILISLSVSGKSTSGSSFSPKALTTAFLVLQLSAVETVIYALPGAIAVSYTHLRLFTCPIFGDFFV